MKLRIFWEKAGFYLSLAAMLLMLGGAGVWYRSVNADYAIAVQAPPEKNVETVAPVQTEKGRKYRFDWPAEGEILLPHAPEEAIYRAEIQAFSGHIGMDIALAEGESVFASETGTVCDVYKSPEYGCTVEVVTKEGILLRYGGLSPMSDVQRGESVYRGQKIGSVGNYPCAETASGPHLHFEVLEGGVSQNPEEYLAEKTQ